MTEGAVAPTFALQIYARTYDPCEYRHLPIWKLISKPISTRRSQGELSCQSLVQFPVSRVEKVLIFPVDRLFKQIRYPQYLEGQTS